MYPSYAASEGSGENQEGGGGGGDCGEGGGGGVMGWGGVSNKDLGWRQGVAGQRVARGQNRRRARNSRRHWVAESSRRYPATGKRGVGDVGEADGLCGHPLLCDCVTVRGQKRPLERAFILETS